MSAHKESPYDGSTDGRAHLRKIINSAIAVPESEAPTKMMQQLVDSCAADSPVSLWLSAELAGPTGSQIREQQFGMAEWNAFAERFNAKYGSKLPVWEVYKSLHMLRQLPGQSLESYNSSFETLRCKALTI